MSFCVTINGVEEGVVVPGGQLQVHVDLYIKHGVEGSGLMFVLSFVIHMLQCLFGLSGLVL